jgi:hypothetical protein
MNNKKSRSEIIKWWNKLPFNSRNTIISKTHYFEDYKKNNFTPANDYSQLTGRELEIIYNSKIKMKKLLS